MTDQATELRFKPQELLLALGGALILDTYEDPLPTRVFLDVLGSVGVSADATRSVLTRLTERGLLTRHQDGRVASYGLTETSRRVLREGRRRVRTPDPFHQASSDWTLLSFSLPESQRDVRSRLRSRLTWAGFGCLRDGLWIAPGRVDLDSIIAVGADVGGLSIDGFVAAPAAGTDVARFVRRAWDLDALRWEHEEFLRRWDRPLPRGEDPLALFTLLGAHWIRLLRSDPVLPERHLGEDWPGRRSAAVYGTVVTALEARAQAAFADLVRDARARR
ncbi:PaaX family transcriptional regulator C-terminal domain-containing protein [Modestobacter marinus]|uniref:PaaX family transcriptional regulator n=1 Tax=Modestobacter marinus TaxID=477641 RepID=A0A846LQ26_9ACTN|nr:PaaX family transcriptional regulator C-terminal domain-containing protein [Modestobacter marinus]NIH68574.1 phenylacetic acid degradation operon negative regulatory protein [Modestobacter marinus]GGL58339.1 PaaX family transcriptional regulator [Modestobacter marinus]